jgi:hypothetical protein
MMEHQTLKENAAKQRVRIVQRFEEAVIGACGRASGGKRQR